jgi:diguanylate cyclase
MVMATRYNPTYVALSVLVAIFASYVALEFATVLIQAKGRARAIWLTCGAIAMGFGIWSMHFVGMLAFEMPGMSMAYDVPLMILSILVAISGSWLALFVVSRPLVNTSALVASGCAMAAAISGMHYTGMYSMRMAAKIEWNFILVALSVLIALVASFSALLIALKIRFKSDRNWYQFSASVVMGFAISGMHYTGMIAATFVQSDSPLPLESDLLATDGLAIAVIAATLLILGLALASSAVEQALALKTKKAEESAELYREAEKAVVDLRLEREIRDRFMSALAHDLRTPLTAAKMSAQLGIRQSSNQEAVERLCAKAVENLQRMDHMIQDLLDAHRISAGKPLALQIEPCNVATLMESIMDDLTTVYGQRFVFRCERTLEAYWDCQAMRRAIENLCTNAVKYGKPASPVTVTVRRLGLESVSIAVHNFGEPILESDQQRLFGLFHRGRSAEASDRRGWGLGLTIVKGIAEAHGGSVSAQSNAKDGTTFILLVPLDPQPETNPGKISVSAKNLQADSHSLNSQSTL